MKWLSFVVVLGASSALAQSQSLSLSGEKKQLETSRNMFFEFKLSPFTPLVDRPFGDLSQEERPWYKNYGNTPMLLGEIEFDFQFFQAFGSLAVGASVGYTEKFGKAFDAATGARIDQSNGVRLLPLKALLVYRWDWAKQKWGIPLVPYLKGAFVAMPYWLLLGSEIEMYSDEVKALGAGYGVKYGFAGVAGLALELDFLDRRLSRDFDSSVGVNHTYLFAEFTLQEMALFNTSAKGLDFSSRHAIFGIGFEF